jgi:hypothetical protein
MSITITIGGTDRTAVVPFSTSGEGEQSEISIEEAVPGIAFANLRIWDATNAISVPDLASVVIADTSNGMNLFTGFVENRKYEPAAVGRWIALSCKDLNGLTDTTLVGVPDGTNWTHDDVTDQYVTTDPFAQVTAGSDASNVQALFAHYWTYPVSVDTTTYVTTVNPAVGSPPIYWDRITLRQALDELADVSSLQTIWWIDADAKLHWTNAPVQGAPTGGSGITGNVLTGFPQISGSGPIAPAPYNLSDTIPTPGGSIAAENMTREDDFAGYALSLYANGATGYTYTPPAAAATTPGHYIATFSGETLVYSRHSDGCIAQPGVLFDPGGPVYVNPQYIVPCSSGGGHFWNMKDGAKTGWLIRQTDAKVTVAPVAVTPAAATIGVGGSGWVQSGTPSYFSRYIDLPSSASQPQRDSLGGAALAFSQRFLTRGSCEVTGPAYLFRAGMGIYITSAQCSLSNAFYPIQKVTTASGRAPTCGTRRSSGATRRRARSASDACRRRRRRPRSPPRSTSSR